MKRVRQNKILELIDEYDIDTQEELGKRLHESGFRVTQATISRDTVSYTHLTLPTKLEV